MPETPRQRMVRRLSYYLLGVGIGFLLLGMLQQARRASMARQQGAEQRAAMPPGGQDATRPQPSTSTP